MRASPSNTPFLNISANLKYTGRRRSADLRRLVRLVVSANRPSSTARRTSTLVSALAKEKTLRCAIADARLDVSLDDPRNVGQSCWT